MNNFIFNICNMKNSIYNQLMIRSRLMYVCAVLTLLWLPTRAPAAELVVVEQAGCEWCEAWDAEIGIVYSKTVEGRIAPLRRVDIHDPLPHNLQFIRGLVFTPTFVLVDGGREIGRISGYPGEDFFWGLLQRLIEKMGDETEIKTRTGSATKEPSKTPKNAGIRG